MGEVDGISVEDVPHSEAAAARAVQLAVKGEVEALMKGSLHTDELMGAVVASAGIVLGARVPIVLTSRADPREARIASCAVALVVARRAARGTIAIQKPALEAIAS